MGIFFKNIVTKKIFWNLFEVEVGMEATYPQQISRHFVHLKNKNS